jgi:hypothetical protein
MERRSPDVGMGRPRSSDGTLANEQARVNRKGLPRCGDRVVTEEAGPLPVPPGSVSGANL